VNLPELARALAVAAAYLGGGAVDPAPVERTDGSPWVWCSAQALRSRVDAAALAGQLTGQDLGVAVRARPDGWLELTLTPGFLATALLAAPAPAPAVAPGPATDRAVDGFAEAVARFEVARTAGGAPALDPTLAGRRIPANPAFVVLLAHARAVRLAHSSGIGRADVPAEAFAELADPLDRALITELLDAPRRMATRTPAPEEVAACLSAVATAYLAWEERAPVGPTRPGQPSDAVHLARQVVSLAGLGVLERGMSLLGITPTGRM